MRDIPVIRSFPPRLAVMSCLRADEVNAKGFDPRQQRQNSLTTSAEHASQSAVSGSHSIDSTGQPSAGKRPRENVPALTEVFPSEAEHRPKLARIEIQEHLQSQSEQPHQQRVPHMPQFHGQRQNQQQKPLEQRQEQQAMDFVGMDDIGMECSEDLSSSRSGVEFDPILPPPPEVRVRREIFFADFF